MKQLNKFKVEFEFEDGEVTIRCTSFRGIRNASGRPYYATVTYLEDKSIFLLDRTIKYIVYADVPNALAGGYSQKGRVLLKPAWFHKAMTVRSK